ncbi:MAG: hypothetical protein AB7P03_08680 [Kofleriaceae bacterium]
MEILETYPLASARSHAVRRRVLHTVRLTRPLSELGMLPFLNLVRATPARLHRREHLFRNRT